MTSPPPLAHPWAEWGGVGPTLLFLHANGFPPGTYARFFSELGRSFRVIAFSSRPLWPDSDPREIGSWTDLAADLGRAAEFDGLDGSIVAGHSLGGVLSALAAAERPRLFRALVLIDPVIFTGTRSLFWGALKGLGFGRRLPLIRGARRRRDHFPDLDAVRQAYRRKRVFSSWNRRVLEDYVHAGFRDVDDGVELRYRKAWEARIFELTPATVWRQLRRIDVPVLLIRGGRSDTFLAPAARRARRQLPTAQVVELPDLSHFLPMEEPATLANVITSWSRRKGLQE